MKKYLNIFLPFAFLWFGCTSSEESDPNGRVYLKASVTPALSGLDIFVFGTEDANVRVETGSTWQTDTFLFPKNQNLVYEFGFLDSENQCYTVEIEVFFDNKSIDKRIFEMNASYNIGYINCKDSNPQSITLITPK